MSKLRALAIGAHPDDIEFRMAGTLLLLKEAGYEIHYFNVANGDRGSMKTNRRQTARIRALEARRSARLMGAQFHPSITSDLEVFYNQRLLEGVAAVIRGVNPRILLTHPPQDYMEDHTCTCRLAVTAAFTRSMPNYSTRPQRRPVDGDVTIYHCVPHGFCDQMRMPVEIGAFVNTESVHSIKREALSQHQSQQDWLDSSQGFNSYLQIMEDMSLTAGKMSRKFKHAEGWRRHLHFGYCGPKDDPLAEALKGKYLVNRDYEGRTQKGL